MRIPIKAVREFADKYGLSHVIVFADEYPKKMQHIATFGRTIKDCDQAAQFGDMMKDVLGWPEKMHAMPNRVKRLQVENAQLRTELAADKLAFDEGKEVVKKAHAKIDQLRTCKDEARAVMLAWHTTAGAEWLEKYPEETK